MISYDQSYFHFVLNQDEITTEWISRFESLIPQTNEECVIAYSKSFESLAIRIHTDRPLSAIIKDIEEEGFNEDIDFIL